MLAVAGVLIVGTLMYAYVSIQAAIERLERDHSFIRNENARLARETSDVASLRDDIAALLARKQIVETIDGWAVPAAEAMAALSRLPANVRLTGLTIDGGRMSVLGETDSESDAASALRAWSASPVVHNARIAAFGPDVAAAAPATGRQAFRIEAEVAFSPPATAHGTPPRKQP